VVRRRADRTAEDDALYGAATQHVAAERVADLAR
jgi:hypothetical protein